MTSIRKLLGSAPLRMTVLAGGSVYGLSKFLDQDTDNESQMFKKFKLLADAPPTLSKPNLDPHAMNFPSSEWDFKWDRRHVPKEEVKADGTMQTARSKATRHLLLIRHGQYNLEGKTDEEKILTELGRKQVRLQHTPKNFLSTRDPFSGHWNGYSTGRVRPAFDPNRQKQHVPRYRDLWPHCQGADQIWKFGPRKTGSHLARRSANPAGTGSDQLASGERLLRGRIAHWGRISKVLSQGESRSVQGFVRVGGLPCQCHQVLCLSGSPTPAWSLA